MAVKDDKSAHGLHGSTRLDLLPVLLLEQLGASGELARHNLGSTLRLALLQVLADTQDDLDAFLDGCSSL